MIDGKILDDFTEKANTAWQQFCIWVYSNNNFVKYQDEFDQIVKEGSYFSNEEVINNSCKYKNFWDVVIPSLQHSWMLSVARLIDPSCFQNDPNKPRLSIYYILELMEDIDLKQDIETELHQQKEFIESIRTQRTNFIAHNSLTYTNKMVKHGVEKFFYTLDCIIKRIKDKKPHLRECNNINLDFTEKLSEAGVKEIFSKITTA